jgi:hypothetical protein
VPAHRRVLIVEKEKSSPTWIDVKASLLAFDRAGLLGLIQNLYAVSKDNEAFLHARLGLGRKQLEPYKARISKSICPDMMRNEPISISKAKKAIADYEKAIGHPEGLAELSIFYCEEAVNFLESCSMEDEGYFVALIRTYGRALTFVSKLSPAERSAYLKRLDKLRPRSRCVAWGVEDNLNDLWYGADLDSQRSE